MDLTSPVGSLIPSMEGAVLDVLAGTHRALGPTKIAELARRGSRSGISLALDRLTEQGLVVAEPTNYGHAYRLNRDHVLAPAVLTAAKGREEFLRRLTDACGSLHPEPVSAALYGSVARRESGPESDIDLVIAVDGERLDRIEDGWTRQMDEMSQRVFSWSGNRLETIVVDVQHLRDLAWAGDPLIVSLRDEAVTLAGRDMRELLNEAIHGGRLSRK